MGIVLLYGLAAFLETGIGIWMFSQVFPKREKMEKRHRFSEWMVFFWITLCAYTFPNTFFVIKDKEKYIWSLVGSHFVIITFYIILKSWKGKLNQNESLIIKMILFIGMDLCVGAQFWASYQSYSMALAGNIYPVFFLWTFYKCTFLQAYLWQFTFTTNLGILKNLYITYAGVFDNRKFEDFFYWPRNHTYQEAIYLLIIYMVLIILNKYTPLKKIIAELLEEHKRILFLFTIFEWVILLKNIENGTGGVERNNLTTSLLITGISVLGMMIMYIRAITRTAVAEKKLLDIRNEVVERQYFEIKETYERYRCMVHDEKHMLLYLQECLENRDISHAQNVINSYQEDLNQIGRCRWTGIQMVDSIFSIKKKRIDDLSVKLQLDCQLHTIPIDEADFIVMFSNLIDNALEAVEHSGIDERKIKIILKNINSMFLLKVTNTCKLQPHIKNQRFLTNKENKEEHGWGIESVKHIVKKYNGDISFNSKENLFEVSIIINF